MKRLVIAAVAALACVAAPAVAQQAPTYVWINFVTAQPGQGEALVREMIKEDGRLFDPLIDSGAALDWGIAMPVVHDGGDRNSYVEWVSFAGWAGADAFMGSFMAQQGAMSEQESKDMAARWETLVIPGSHADMINESVHMGAGSAGRPSYINLGYHRARPGMSDEARAAYDEVVVPVFDKLVAEGKVINYGLHVPAVHRGATWTHMTWYMSRDLATRDAVGAAYAAAAAARSAQENAAIRERWNKVMDPEGHSDQILLILHHKVAGAE